MAMILNSDTHGVIGLEARRSTSSSLFASHTEDTDELTRANLEARYASALAAKKCVLLRGKKGWEVIDLSALKPAKATFLLEQVLESAPPAATSPDQRDVETIMRLVRDRFDAVGIRQPSVEVRFKRLSVEGEAPATSTDIPTLTSQVTDMFRALAKAATCTRTREGQPITILNSISGVFVPGRITLLLGPPGAGKSTMLKALAGQLATDDPGLKLSYEELSYNGQPLSAFVPERTSAYIAQRDEHYAQLTVQETLDFSAQVQGASTYSRMLRELEALERERGLTPDPNTVALMDAMAAGGKHDLLTPVILQVLGLEGCKDTIVGSSMVRGVSGGQRKRVTTGEMVVGPMRTLFCDEISTGLDSATTTDIVGALKTYARIMEATLLIALLQPPPETFDLFDDVLILAEGHIAYHGPRDGVLSFFQGLGFDCPADVALADFLQEVVLPSDQGKYWAGDAATFRPIPPAEVSKRFYASSTGAAALGPLASSFPADKVHNDALAKEKFGRPALYLLRCVLRRGAKLQRASLPISIARLVQTAFTAFMVATLFMNTAKQDVSDGLFFLAVAFFSVTFMTMVPMADTAELVDLLPTFYKQRNANFFPAWCFGVAQVALRVPWILMDSTVWSLIVYFSVGYVKSARFLVFWATCFLSALFGLTLFAAIGGICRVQTTTSAVESFLLLVFVNAAGFVITPSSIPGGWKGAYYANPWSYWIQGLAVNEFTSADWSMPMPGGNGSTVGEAILQSRGYTTDYSFVWVGLFAWGIGSAILNMGVLAAALTFLSPNKTPATAPAVEASAPPLENGTAPKSAVTAINGGKSVQSVDTATSSAIPFTPMVMTFQDLKYSVVIQGSGSTMDAKSGTDTADPHAGQLLLLKGITGSFRPGVLTALMGSSGAGKTTLLDVLAGRKTGGTITGDVRVNGHPKDQATFARVSGYVEQDDIHGPFATVHEALQFSARLRLPSDVPAAKVEAFVAEIMDLVELTTIKASLVGSPGVNGLSVEQRKRLTLAVELVANPAIVFMDEPTSGLDARAAAVVMRAARNVVATGRTVVCTIHQPSHAIFSSFMELLLLKRGGETIFFGELGPGAANLVAYLEGLPGVTPIEPKVNPANWMLDVTSVTLEAKSGVSFAELYSRSALAQSNADAVRKLATPALDSRPLDLASLKVAPWGRQLRELLRRDSQSYKRDLSYNLTRLVISLIIGICYGTLYQGQGTSVSTQAGLYNIAGALFASVLFLGITDSLMVQEVSSVKRGVFYREHAAGTYSCSAFSLSEALVELPYLLAQSLAYSLLVYWMIGFEANAGKFFWFLAVMFVTLGYFTYFGQMSIHLCPSLQLAQALTSVMFAILQLFCGYLKPQPAIPKGWIWLYWLNPVSYTLYGLVSNQLGDVETLTTLPSGQQVTVSSYVETFFGFKYKFYPWTIVIMLAFCLALRVAALTALKFLKFQIR